MAVNEAVYGAKELWTSPFGDATNAVNSIKIANYNLASPNNQTRMWCQMYTNTSHNYTIYNEWDNRSNDIIDSSIVPFGIGLGSGISNIDWYTVKNGAVSTTPSNTDRRQITNIAFSYDDQMAASTWCLDGQGVITGGVGTAQTYNQRLCYNRWSNLYGTAFSTGSSSAGGGSARYSTSWYNTRLFTYLPTKNLVLTPYATIVNSGGTATSYTKINDIISHKNDGKLIRFGVRFSYKPTGTRTDIPIAPFFMDDTNVQKGFSNYPVPSGGIPEIVDQTIKLPIIYNRTGPGFFVLLGTGAFNYYIALPTDADHNYTWATFQGDKIKFEPETINGNLYMTSDISQLSDDDIEHELLTQMAYMGMLFVTDANDVAVSIYDDKMYCGEIQDGVTTGRYTHGTANLLQPQMQWDDYFQSGYNPYNPPAIDPNDYSVGMHTNSPWIASPNHLYSINSTWVSSILSLYNSLWECYYTNNVGSGSGQLPPTEFNFDEFLTVSPIDTIVSLKLFPYDTKKNTTLIGIKLGKYATGVNAYNADLCTKLDFGTVSIFPYFGNDWRDRETKYTLYAPFCGTLDLDPSFYVGHIVGLEYWIDQITGACTAALYITDSNNVKVYGDTVSGTLAVDVPITGLDQATIQAQIFNANQQLKNANINAATGLINASMSIVSNAAIGNAPGAAAAAISGISNLIKNNNAVEAANYNLNHTKMSPRIIGAASPLCAMLGDWIPRIIVSIPIDPLTAAEQQIFSQTKGFACIIPDKISNHSGYVQAINLKIIPPDQATTAPTETEIEMIKSLLASGIYI